MLRCFFQANAQGNIPCVLISIYDGEVSLL